MRYAQINVVPNGSTGGIMLRKHRELLDSGADSVVFWGRGRLAQSGGEVRFARPYEVLCDILCTRIDGKAGFHSHAATRRLIRMLDSFNPDVVHLHNLHGYYLNLEMLFQWLRKREQETVWTLHDCWAFTGHCAYFTRVRCDQWKTGCGLSAPCPQLRCYPKTLAGNSSCVWCDRRKRETLTLLSPELLTIKTPSHWLGNLVKESFFSQYPVQVERNEVDEEIFKPTPSDFRNKYGLTHKIIILGVASTWTREKGLEDFVRLSNDLDERFTVVLVGLNKKQIKAVPNSIVALPRTESGKELASIYSAADLHVQPSIQETFGMTVVEAQSCGTPVLVREGTACFEIGKNQLTYSCGWSYRDLLEMVDYIFS